MRYVARRTARGDFDQLLYGLARQSGLQRAKQVVILGDGALWIWKQAEEHFPGAVQIVDLYHAQEHVWQVARAVYGPQTEAAELWAKKACDLLVQGHIEKLVAAITALPPIAPDPGESRSVPEKAIDYFTANAERMRYPTFRAQGMHVGSGIAEAGCQNRCGYSPQALGYALDSWRLGCSFASAHLRSQPHLRRLLGGPTSSGCLGTHN